MAGLRFPWEFQFLEVRFSDLVAKGGCASLYSIFSLLPGLLHLGDVWVNPFVFPGRLGGFPTWTALLQPESLSLSARYSTADGQPFLSELSGLFRLTCAWCSDSAGGRGS